MKTVFECRFCHREGDKRWLGTHSCRTGKPVWVLDMLARFADMMPWRSL